MKNVAKKTASLTTFTLALVVFAGCNDNKSVSHKSITGDLTPELHSTSQNKAHYHNDFAISSNMNLRMFWDDLGRALYTSTPSKLSPYPITSLGGEPR